MPTCLYCNTPNFRDRTILMQFREGVGQGRDRGIIGPKQVMNTQKNVNQENGSVLQYFADLLHQFIQNVPYV